MFHANGWGFAYAAWLAGASLILPDRYVQADVLTELIASERPAVSGGVPTCSGPTAGKVDKVSLRQLHAAGKLTATGSV
jgi:hypothetical protein